MQMPDLARRYIILFSDRAVTAYKRRLRIWCQRKTKGTYSVDDLVQKLRQQFYKKDKVGKRLKLKS